MTKRKLPENFQSRWGDDELDDNGYLYVPGWIMRHYHQLQNKEGEVVGLTPNEFTFLCHVMCFKYDVPTAQAKPSLETIAERVGRHVSNVRNWKDSLIKKGLLSVTHIDGKPSVYDFAALVKQCRKFASEIATPSEITRGSEITSPTPSEITRTPLAESLGEESEVKQNISKKQNNSKASSNSDDARAITAVIKAWLDSTGAIDPSAYKKKGYRDLALAMHGAGITPNDVTAFVINRRTDTFWKDKRITLANIAESIQAWKGNGNQPPSVPPVPPKRTIAPEEVTIPEMWQTKKPAAGE